MSSLSSLSTTADPLDDVDPLAVGRTEPPPTEGVVSHRKATKTVGEVCEREVEDRGRRRRRRGRKTRGDGEREKNKEMGTGGRRH